MPRGSLAHVNPADILDRIAAGEYISHIAHKFGVAPQSLHEHVRDHPGYKAAMQIRHLLKLDQTEQALGTSPDLARAREQFKAAAWRAERECPATWGARGPEITITNNVLSISDSLAGSAADLLERLRATAVALPDEPISDQ